MSQTLFIVLTLACFSWKSVPVNGQEETILNSPNVTNFGTWGTFENCTRGRLVTSFQVKVEPKHSVDDTGLNGIRFFCGKSPSSADSEWQNVTSRVGYFGNWGHVFNCSTYAVGFRLQSQPYQGPNGDDTAADNVIIYCADGEAIEGFNDNGHTFTNSTYTGKQECPTGEAFCGLQTQVERYQVFGDDTSLNNIRVKCCNINLPAGDTPVSPNYPIIGGDESQP